MKRRILSLAMVLALLLCLAPASAAAADFEIADGVLTAYNGAGGAVTIPAGVTEIGNRAFRNTAVTEVTIPAGVTRIGDWAFYGCEKLTRAALPDSLTELGEWAFAGCKALEEITIPDGVTSIGECAFYRCDALQTLTIPKSVTEIGDSFTDYCTALTAITVDGANPSYASLDGVLFSKDMTTLIRCPEGLEAEEYTVPDGVRYIGKEAVEHCINLREVTIGDSVETVGEDAFQHCGVYTLFLGKNLREIGEGAFNHVVTLKHVTFYGTEAEWNAIEIGKFNDYLLNAEIRFADGNSAAEAAAQALHALGLFKGTGTDPDNPVFELDRAPTRAEAITMLVRLLGKEEEAQSGEWSMTFTDVPDWAKPYVGYAYANGLTNGYNATTFGSSDPVTDTQYISFVLSAMGYVKGTDFQWDRAWELSDQLYFTHGEYRSAEDFTFLRGDVAVISYNALAARCKGGAESLQNYLIRTGVLPDDRPDDGGSGQSTVETPPEGVETHTCPRCNGNRTETCPACGGAGSLPMTRNVPDPLQPGVFRTEVYQATCGTCGGTGRITCMTCLGRGYVYG